MNLTDVIKEIRKENTLVNYKDNDPNVATSQYFYCTHIKKKSLLVKGEYAKPKSGTRNALIIFFDSRTGEVKGETQRLFPKN